MGAFNFLFIWLHQVLAVAQGILFFFSVVAWELLVVACGILVPLPGLNPGLLHWKHRSLAVGSPGKSPHGVIKYAKSGCISQSGMKRKEENRNRMSQSPFWGTAFCLDASLLHGLSGQGRPPSLTDTLNRTEDFTILFSTAQCTYPFGYTSWSFFRAQPLGPHLAHCAHWVCGCCPH